MKWSQNHELGADRKLTNTCQDILGGMLLHLLTTHRRVGLANTGKKQSQILVNLRGSTDGGARIARYHFLLDGNRRRQSFDKIVLGFAHAAQKLAGITGERLYIATLSLGIERVESQGTFTRATHSSKDNKLVARYLKTDILQVVDPYASDVDIFHL